MRLLIVLLIGLAWPLGAQGEPIVKIVNFTAAWCPTCAVLDPKIRQARADFPAGEIGYVPLDFTQVPSQPGIARTRALDRLQRTAYDHKALYVWEWFGATTGVFVIIAADTGEAISCGDVSLSAGQIAFRLQEAQILTRRRAPGDRKPNGPDCPVPLP